MKRLPYERWIGFLVFVLFVCCLAVFVARFPARDDDKCVLYFSAAYMKADPAKQIAVRNNVVRWQESIVASNNRKRLWNQKALEIRISYPWNYPLLNTAIAFFHDRVFAGNENVFPLSLKAALMLLHVLALGWLVYACRRNWEMALLVTAALLIAAWCWVPLPGLVEFRWKGGLPLSYPPSAAAIPLVLAALVCMARNDRVRGGLSCALVFLWHMGLGVMCVITLAATLAFRRVLAPGRAGPPPDRLRAGLLFSLAGIAVCVLTWMARRSVGFGVEIVGPAALVFAAGFALRRGPREERDWLGLVTACGSFLAASGWLVAVVSAPAVVRMSKELPGLQLFHEIPRRLGGARHGAAMVLILAGIMFLVERYGVRGIAAQGKSPRSWRLAVLTVVAAVAMAGSVALCACVRHGDSAFLSTAEARIETQEVVTSTLHTLDPNRKYEFFLSLAKYLWGTR
jgi:hypothetical protein